MSDFPFPYFFHGALDPSRVGKSGSAVVGFQAKVGERERLAIQKSVPDAFAGFFKWSDTLFFTESFGNVFAEIIFGDAAAGDVKALAAFSAQTEAWVRVLHAKQPLAFFVGPTASLPGDPWDAWSWQQAPSQLLPWLERYADSHPDSLRDDADDDDDRDASEPMASAGRVDREAMRSLLAHFDAAKLGGAEVERAKKLLARFGL